MNKIRVLLINDEAKAKIAKVIKYAEDHPWFPETGTVPGEDENFVVHLNEFRTVFTITHHEKEIYRQLSISVPAPGKYPAVVAAFIIADLFGFTGYDENDPKRPGDGWTIDLNSEREYVSIMESIATKGRLN